MTVTHTLILYKHTQSHTHKYSGVFTLGGHELPECDDNKSEEDGSAQEDCYDYGCDGSGPQNSLILVQILRVRRFLKVEAEGQLGHVLGRVFGCNLDGWISRYGVLVVSAQGRIIHCPCVYKIDQKGKECKQYHSADNAADHGGCGG